MRRCALFFLLGAWRSPQQFLVNEGHVSGLIDFEFPRSGDPTWEFAYWDFYTGNQPFMGARVPTQWLLEGYRQTGSLDPTFDLPIAVWQSALSLELVAYHRLRDDQEPDFLTFLRIWAKSRCHTSTVCTI